MLFTRFIAIVSLIGISVSDAAKNGVLTNDDKQALLKVHNDHRSNTALGKTGNQPDNQPMATDMTKLVWDEDIAKGAASYAAKCVWAHDRNSIYGENLSAAGSSNDDNDNLSTLENGIASGWYDEHKFYDFDTGICEDGEQCGHYTQEVWANTKKLGCGYARCSNSIWKGSNYFEIILVCRYNPPGNWNDEFPYKQITNGAGVASNCPEDYTADFSTGLCVLGNSNPTPAPVPATSQPTPVPTDNKDNDGSTPAPVPATSQPTPVPTPSSPDNKDNDDSCMTVDSTLRFKIGKKRRKCKWASKGPKQKRCDKEGVRDACPETCGRDGSCEESSLTFNTKKTKGFRDCTMLKQQILCGKDGVKETCFKTCN